MIKGPKMTQPIIGIVGNRFLISDSYEITGTGTLNVRAIADATGAVPLIVATNRDVYELENLMEVCDGFLFTGARPNVHPDEYGHTETEAHGEFDRERDALSLPLIRALAKRGQPFLGVCRGFQEVAVAFGCTLHPEIRDVDGRDNHRMPDGTLEEKFALRHEVIVTPNGPFAKVFGVDRVMTNSLHGQAIWDGSDQIVIDGFAPDGTPEAIYVKDAVGFTMAVQWHPEWKAAIDPVSKPLFEAFGKATKDWHMRKSV